MEMEMTFTLTLTELFFAEQDSINIESTSVHIVTSTFVSNGRVNIKLS